ncbi:MAG: penicillin-binding protein 1C [Desulfobulbaceae bacterium A2]|nr:MAG: penicillin-binding protein 1C [Desulfobulbaceae bacterium A2]
MHRGMWRWRWFALLVAGGVLASIWLVSQLAPPPLLVNRANGSYALIDREGQLLRLSLTSDEKYRLWTPLAEMPQALQEATLHYEDRWFYRHPGVNVAALLRASWGGLISGERRRGASTLTMQLARQRWRLKTQSIPGKLRQIVHALWLEYHFDKATLLEAYLNLAPYGANIEGVGAAAWVYFHKPVAALSRDEARVLALIPQNPRARAPMNPAAQQVLRQAWRTAYGKDPGVDRIWYHQRRDLPLRAPHLAERLHALFPDRPTLSSTLDRTVQELSEDMVRAFVRRHSAAGIANADVMVVDTATMEVLAYVGSAGYGNRAIQGFINGLKAPRSPGSALKPFIYAQAIAQGLITPDTRLKDTPQRMGDYQPENFERNFYGPLSATEALVRSRNIPAISLLAQLRQPSFHQFLLQAGVQLPREAADYGMSLAIGGAEISMEDVLRLYAILANDGVVRDLCWLRDDPAASGTRVLLPEAAFLAREMLQGNPRPQRVYGGRQFGRGQPVAWKTGTSSGQKDAWAIGLMGNILVGVWAGNFDGSPNQHLVGRELTGPLLFDILEAIAVERPLAAPAPPPPNLKRIEICPLSGRPPSPWCPRGHFGWIIPGVSPIKPCTVHRQIRVNPASGRRLCPGDPGGEGRVAEFWESDEIVLFSQAGLRRDNPPPFEHPCDDAAEGDADSRHPRIVSPQPGVQYPVRAGGGSMLEFSAIASGGRHRLFWFVEGRCLGEGATVFWPARSGKFEVVVVDDQGQATTTSLTAVAAE